MFMDEVVTNSSTYTHRFYLTQPIRVGGIMRPYVSGRVREKGDDFVRIRTSSGYREWDDIVIPLHSIVYMQQSYNAE